MTNEGYEELRRRVKKGKQYVEEKGGWGGSRTPAFDYRKHTPRTELERAIKLWFLLSEELLQEDCRRGFYQKQEKHSLAWHNMKFEETLVKWKATRKALRGPDPRLLPRESFI